MSLAQRLSVFVLGLLTPMVALASEERGRPLHFDEVLQSVNEHDPRHPPGGCAAAQGGVQDDRGPRCV